MGVSSTTGGHIGVVHGDNQLTSAIKTGEAAS
jgi:hypothetical protein